MKKAFGFIFLILFTFGSRAQDIDRPEMLKVAKGFFQEHSMRKAYSEREVQLKDFSRRDTTLFYMAHDGENFVILANDKRVPPILGYSLDGTYRKGAYPPQLKDLLESYSRQIIRVKREPIKKSGSPYSGQWDDFLSGSYPSMKASVEPIIDVKWDQGAGWNRYCPEDADGPGGHAYVGCVAVAMGQAMSVYEHPGRGVGESSYFHSEYGEISANYGETDYQWGKMSATSSDDHNSLLLYHLAVSVEMDFAPDGSGAYTRDAASALREHFDYSRKLYYKSSTEDEAWTELIKSELDAGRPLVYGGNNGSDVGHAFNLDGYNDNDDDDHTNDFFHVNWGWSGNYNGYYQLENLVPYDGANYSENAKAIFRIMPMDHSPTDIELSDKVLVDTLDVGDVVSTIRTIDPDPQDSFQYEVSGAPGVFGPSYCPFFTEADSLRLAEEVSYADYKELRIVIASTDGQGNTIEKDFTIEVRKGNYPPTNISLSSTAVYDTMRVGAFVGKFSTSDPDESDSFTYSFAEPSDAGSEAGRDNGKFSIAGDSLLTDYDFTDYPEAECSILVKSTDSHSESVNKEFILEVNQVQTEVVSSNFNDIQAGSVQIYPNPASSRLHVVAGEQQIATIELFNSLGALLRTHHPKSSEKILNLSDLHEGVYMIRVKFDSGGTKTYKFIKRN